MAPMSFRDAAARVAVTVVQAAAAFVLAAAALFLSGSATSTAVASAAVGSFLVPVATAIHRFAGAWLAARGGVD